MVALGIVIVAGIEVGVGDIESVSISLRTLTRLLMVSRIFLTFSMRGWDSISFKAILSTLAYKVAAINSSIGEVMS